MIRKAMLVVPCLCVAGLTAALAMGPGEGKKDAAPEMKLPPGWTEQDMAACMTAATPGKDHAAMTAEVGTWSGKSEFTMGPGGETMHSVTNMKATMIMDGRFLQCEVSGDMPGMGPFKGMGIYGFDNTTQKHQATWIDNMNTTMMQGTGERSADGKVMTFVYNFTCPITKKPSTFREVTTTLSANTMRMEMFGIDPKSGKEYRMGKIDFTRQSK